MHAQKWKLEYHYVKEVFSKTKASGMPPHCTYNYTTELMASVLPLHNPIYPLSTTE